MTTVTTISNAIRLASAVQLAAVEIARTGLGIASIDAKSWGASLHSETATITIGIHANSEADARTLATLWPAVVEEPSEDQNVYLSGDWVGTDICILIFARREVQPE